ncbi:hypothetical protein ABZ914_50820 [Spirillospora sp. NPDC046719]
MTSSIDDVLGGCIGFFHPIIERKDLKKESQRGYIQLAEDGFLRIDTLEEDLLSGFSTSNRRIPEWIKGRTQHAGILITNMVGFGSSFNIGGTKASVHRYRGQTLIFGIDPRLIDTPKVTSISAFFPDVTNWAGVSALQIAREIGEDNRYKGMSMKVESSPPARIQLSRALTLELGTHWEVSGSESRKTVYAPLKVTCSSSRGKDIHELIGPIFHLQNLINLAHQGLVAADGGQAFTVKGTGDRNPEFWNHALMFRPPSSVAPKSMTETPLFSLSHVGGIEGLRRWINISKRHSRSVIPATRAFRTGKISPEVQMMDIAAGIEYWTAAHARTARWSRERPQSLAVARQAGEHFAEWVGDIQKWADIFWNEYNAIKHRPNHLVDPYKARILADSGQVLLACILLRRVARSKSIVANILDSHQLNRLGHDIRHIVL